MKVVLELEDVTDEERSRLIGYVCAYPILWAKGQPKNAKKTTEAWNFIAAALSTAERVFEVALVKKLWKDLRDQYLQNVKAGNASSTTWQYQNALAFLGTNCTTRAKKLKKEEGGEDETEQPAKKMVKQEESQQQEAMPQIQYPQLMQNIPFQMSPQMQQFYMENPMQQQLFFMPRPAYSQIESSSVNSYSTENDGGSDTENFATPERVTTFKPAAVLSTTSPANFSTNISSSNEELNQANNNVEKRISYSDVQPAFESIRAELATFIKRLIELENKFRV